jgi:hypothetical protein
VRSPLRLPGLGGTLGILNGLLWVGLIWGLQNRFLPEAAWVGAAAVVLSLPMAWPLILFPPLHPSEGQMVSAGIWLGLNALVFGYGCEWAWRHISWRFGVRLVAGALIVVLSVLWVLWPYF